MAKKRPLLPQNWLRKLPDSRREPPGLEWRIWKKLPLFLLGGTAVPLFAYTYAHLFPDPGSEPLEKYLSLVGILVTASIITVWTAVFTVAIGCFVVRVMKGPAYVADEYPLSDAERPRHRSRPARDKSGSGSDRE